MNFKTLAGEAEFMSAYDTALAQWPVPYETRLVPTRFGLTHVIICGPSDGVPLVLLHAQGTSALVWIKNVAALSQDYRIYLIDTVGDANKSVYTAPIGSGADGARWLTEVLDWLEIESAHLGGLSYGGWLAAQFALAAPERLKSLILLAPGATLASLRPAFFVHFLAPMLFPTRKRVHSVFRWLSASGRVVDERLAHQMFLAVRHFRFPKGGTYPTVLTDNELKRLRLPALLLIGDHEVICHPQQAVNRARRLIPFIEAEIIPGAGHVVNMEQPDAVNRRLLQFLRQTQERLAVHG